jgi:hypothetical protein
MGHPREHQPHTLAQFARRAGISDGRARALFAARPSGLPRPDVTDAGGRPLWWPATIDAWCAGTGRAVQDEALWLYRAPRAAVPAAELRRGLVEVDAWPRTRRLYAVVWDTEHGHVVYISPLEDSDEHPDGLAPYAAQVVEPRWWASTLVVVPVDEALNGLHGDNDPAGDVYRLSAHDDGEEYPPPRVPLEGLRRWWTRTVDAMGTADERPGVKAIWETQLPLGEIGRALGVRIPLWVTGTRTEQAANLSLAYDRTFTVPDETTGWPAVQQRLQVAIDIDTPRRYPAAWAALAAQAVGKLRSTRAGHAALPDAGEGWYLVARPALPAIPIDLEQRLTATEPLNDIDQVAADLVELRGMEADLDIDDPAGDVYDEAIGLLTWQLSHHSTKLPVQASDRRRYIETADDKLVTYSAPWKGPVVDAWKSRLTLVDDPMKALRLRRVRRLLADADPVAVRAIYRDPAGRYVLVRSLQDRDEVLWFYAEWPVATTTAATWTDKTVLAADGQGGATALLALTPTDDATMRVDPVPMPPRTAGDAFAYGYGGGTPWTTYTAIVRLALDPQRWDQLQGKDLVRAADGRHGNRAESQLWKAISTTHGPLRLSWPQVRLWARADANTAASDD